MVYTVKLQKHYILRKQDTEMGVPKAEWTRLNHCASEYIAQAHTHNYLKLGPGIETRDRDSHQAHAAPSIELYCIVYRPKTAVVYSSLATNRIFANSCHMMHDAGQSKHY